MITNRMQFKGTQVVTAFPPLRDGLCGPLEVRIHPLPPPDSGASFSSFECFVFEIQGSSFSIQGASFSSFGCFVFEIWVPRASVFVFDCFVFETTHTVHLPHCGPPHSAHTTQCTDPSYSQYHKVHLSHSPPTTQCTYNKPHLLHLEQSARRPVPLYTVWQFIPQYMYVQRL